MAKKTTLPETPEISAPEDKPVFINNYPEKLCHKRSAQTFFNSVNFKLGDAWASFTLPINMSLDATRRDGTHVDGCVSLFLGDANRLRKVSIRNADGSFDTVEMTNQQILDQIQASRAEYKASQV